MTVKRKSVKARIIICVLLIVLLIVTAFIYDKTRYYTDKDFGIDKLVSIYDKDNDGIDDYTDIVEGAREYLKDKPQYKSVYYIGGYPDDNNGVCTDVIWYALKQAGYDLKSAVDSDIAQNEDYYMYLFEKPDPNIDFRRVRNLRKFFSKNEMSLTLDTSKIDEWHAGDIVTFKESHIAVISDRRNKDGIPYIIHQSPLKKSEDDLLTKYTVDGHFRITGEYIYG